MPGGPLQDKFRGDVHRKPVPLPAEEPVPALRGELQRPPFEGRRLIQRRRVHIPPARAAGHGAADRRPGQVGDVIAAVGFRELLVAVKFLPPHATAVQPAQVHARPREHGLIVLRQDLPGRSSERVPAQERPRADRRAPWDHSLQQKQPELDLEHHRRRGAQFLFELPPPSGAVTHGWPP